MATNMEGELIFKASLKKALLILLLSIAFVVLGAWLTTERPVLGWVSVGFFGLGIPASLFMMRPNATYLKLDHEGFEIGALAEKPSNQPIETDLRKRASIDRLLSPEGVLVTTAVWSSRSPIGYAFLFLGPVLNATTAIGTHTGTHLTLPPNRSLERSGVKVPSVAAARPAAQRLCIRLLR